MGGVVDYFIEALADGETPVAAKGSANKTLKITMLNANGQPLVPVVKKKPTKKVVEADESPSLFFGLGLGGGVGWATGTARSTRRATRSIRRGSPCPG